MPMFTYFSSRNIPSHELFVSHAKGVLAALPLPGVDRYRLIFQAQVHPETLLQNYTGEKVKVTDPICMANFRY